MTLFDRLTFGTDRARQMLARLAPLRSRPGYLVALWLIGGIALGLTTWLCLRVDLDLTTTAFLYLIVIVLLSLLDSFVSSAIFSVTAVLCLNYFFVQPRYSLNVHYAHDLAMLIAFVLTSLAITGLVRQVRTLADSFRHQALLLDLTHDTIYFRDMEDVITYWNRGAEDLYGWTREEALGRKSFELLQTVFPIAHEEVRRIVLRDGRWEGVIAHTRRDGSQVLVSSRCLLQRDESGHPTGTIVTNNDISARLRAEKLLQQSQASYLAEAQRLSSTGSFGWTIADGEIFWSEETFRIFEMEPPTKPTVAIVLDRVHPEDRIAVEQAIERATRDQQAFEIEHRLAMPDGRAKYLHVVAHPVEVEPGHVQFIGAVMDITERKCVENAMRQSEQRYRHLFHHMPISLWRLNASRLVELFKDLRAVGVGDLESYIDTNPDFLAATMNAVVVEEVNDRSVEMFGARHAQELLGPVTRYWRESPDTFRRAMVARYRGEPTFEEETKIVTLDDRVLNVHFATARPGAPSEPSTSIVGIVDITERIRAQQKLQQVQAEFAHASRISMLGELTASIAHEINQPLAAITTNGESSLRWLARAEPDVIEARELLKRIVADARRAADIIVRIRKLATGKVAESAMLSPDDLIRESLLFLRHEMQVRRVAVSLDLAPGVPQVLGDRTQLQQVLVNLILNALQAMAVAVSGQRSVKIATARPVPSTVSCIVEDSGPGIPEAQLGQLFQSFSTTKDGGMGMGLSISRSIIEAHGGTITADNDSALGGARFTFTLPVADRAA